MEESRIYLYEWETGKQLNAIEGDCYIDGSHDTDWEGIMVEKVISTGTFAKNVYIRDCHILLAIDDFAFTKNSSSIDIEPDDLVIAGRNKKFSVNNPGTYTGIFVTLSIDFMKTYFYDRNIEELDFLDFYCLNDNNLKYMVLMIYEQALMKTSKNCGYLLKLFETLCTYYIYNYSNYFEKKKSKLSKKDMVIIDAYILEHLTDNIPSTILAELLNISHYSFMKEFKIHQHMAPSKYILNIKYELSKQLLITTDKTVTEIATSMGFFDNSHFTNFFKNKATLTPNQYRKEHKLGSE